MDKKVKDDIKNSINTIVSISEDEENGINEDIPTIRFQIEKDVFFYHGNENVYIYNKTLKKLFDVDKKVAKAITFSRFRGKLNLLILSLRKEGRECNQQDVDRFYTELYSSEYIDLEVLYSLFGTEINVPFLEFGIFKVYSYDHIKQIFDEHQYLLDKKYLLERRDSDVFLGVKVKARHIEKAYEIANELVGTFENVIRYMMGTSNRKFSIGAINYRDEKPRVRIAIGEGRIGGFTADRDIIQKIDLGDRFFVNPDVGNDRIWELIASSNTNEIEKRILLAIQWIGKGINETDKAKAVIQFVFAIECMLKFSSKDMLNASIGSQIGDSLAFIIEDELEKRKQLVKDFKNLYDLRSAVVHGGDKTVTLENLNSAIRIVKGMVIAILVKNPYKDLSSMDEISKYLTELRFR